mmetsp:Transcript_23193/g.27276  ORF Transcript_23193/g.27276 Transcript_23193/m.27276 type:complete len:93 (-) Transcript_23193:329-607(-)
MTIVTAPQDIPIVNPPPSSYEHQRAAVPRTEKTAALHIALESPSAIGLGRRSPPVRPRSASCAPQAPYPRQPRPSSSHSPSAPALSVSASPD